MRNPNTMNDSDLEEEKGGAVLWRRKGGAGDKELEKDCFC